MDASKLLNRGFSIFAKSSKIEWSWGKTTTSLLFNSWHFSSIVRFNRIIHHIARLEQFMMMLFTSSEHSNNTGVLQGPTLSLIFFNLLLSSISFTSNPFCYEWQQYFLFILPSKAPKLRESWEKINDTLSDDIKTIFKLAHFSPNVTYSSTDESIITLSSFCVLEQLRGE